MYLRHTTVGSVVDPITGEKQEKAVFVVFFAGERARTKILKVRLLPLQDQMPAERHSSIAMLVVLS